MVIQYTHVVNVGTVPSTFLVLFCFFFKHSMVWCRHVVPTTSGFMLLQGYRCSRPIVFWNFVALQLADGKRTERKFSFPSHCQPSKTGNYSREGAWLSYIFCVSCPAVASCDSGCTLSFSVAHLKIPVLYLLGWMDESVLNTDWTSGSFEFFFKDVFGSFRLP